MKLSISNIGWAGNNDELVYTMMRDYSFSGLEIAPTRIFPYNPYEDLPAAREWAKELKSRYGFEVPSMQSIWYGRQEKLFGTEKERAALVDYTKKAIDFAANVGCGNLVFGCPKNRVMPESADEKIAVDFFSVIGDYAAQKGTVIGMEANPAIYNTNYINNTQSALDLVRRVNSSGFKLNLDVGTMVHNRESVDILRDTVSMINHVHISEPGLKPIEKRELHSELAQLLREEGYSRYISIEMGTQENIKVVESAMIYILDVFHQ